jgi:hypothetical protein
LEQQAEPSVNERRRHSSANRAIVARGESTVGENHMQEDDENTVDVCVGGEPVLKQIMPSDVLAQRDSLKRQNPNRHISVYDGFTSTPIDDFK